MAASVECIEGARGLPVAVLNCCYTYHKSKALTNGMKFTCGKRKSVKCKAFVVVSDDGTVVKAEDSHNHQPNLGDVQARHKVRLRRLHQVRQYLLCLNTSVSSHERRKCFPLMPSTRGDIDLDGQ